MNRKISVGMAVSIVILAMTVTFSITMLVAMRLFDSTVSSVKEKESMYNKIAEVDRYVRSNDYYPIDETTLYDRLTAGYLLGTGDKYARYYTASAYTDLLNAQSGKLMGIGVELAIDQSGYANQSYTNQLYGSGNEATIKQTDSINVAYVTQGGQGNKAYVDQSGIAQTATITQLGSANLATVTQK